MIEHIKCSTPDFAKENAKKLLALFPECEGQKGEVDLDKLRQVLSSTAIEGNVERYQFTWPGKRKAMAAASAATTKTLRPCAAESVGKDGTPGGFDSENLYIEGDNLEVLKLLQTSYAGKVKMIYIDPPYNTGHDFVYRDHFSLTQKELDDKSGAFDEDGNRFEVNDSAEARYHSNWCSMMYPRLKLARNLLRDDGVIFISIDDNEITNLRHLCDEVFGEHNCVAQFPWRKRTAKSDVPFGVSQDYEWIVAYARSEKFMASAEGKGRKYYTTPDFPDRPWRVHDLTKQTSASERPKSFFTIVNPRTGEQYPANPNRTWAITEETFEAYYKANKIVFPGDYDFLSISKPALRYWKDEDVKKSGELFGRVAVSTKLPDEIGMSQDGTKEVVDIFGVKVFPFPKPSSLIKFFTEIVYCDDALILDFFSGSASSAHAILQLNAEDGGSRKFIMVQLPEPCEEDSEAAKAGYANICEIGKERIRRAGKKIAEENAITAPNIDIGFRVLKLDTSSLRDTSATVSATNQEFANFERVRSDRSAEDLLFQMLLETHIPLSESIVKAKVAGNEVFFVGATADAQDKDALSGAPLVACLDHGAKMNSEFFIEIAKLKPGIAFFRDDAFADDSARTNLQQVFNQFSPTTSIKVV